MLIPPLLDVDASDHGLRVVGEDDRIVLLLQASLLDILIHQRGVGELELLQDKPGPALVHVPPPVSLVHADPGNLDRCFLYILLERVEDEVEFLRKLLQQGYFRLPNDERA